MTAAESVIPTRTVRPRVRGQRPQLTRGSIVEAALAAVRADGLEAVSMRRIAEDLQTAPMSLYRHVTDRQDLLCGMLDVVAGAIELPPVAADVRTELTCVISAVHRALTRDPWVVTVLHTENAHTDEIHPALERVYAAFARTGLRGSAAVSAAHLIWGYTYGEVLGGAKVSEKQHEEPEPPTHDHFHDEDHERYPHLTSAYAALAESEDGTESFFAINLQRLLAGLLPAGY